MIIHRIETPPEKALTRVTLVGNIVLHINETPETILTMMGEMK